jgi:RNase H-fold protein (predicted Holliday junction resolvase)
VQKSGSWWRQPRAPGCQYLAIVTFTGSATIGYTISDGNAGTATALITVNVTNRPPVAINDIVSTAKNAPKANAISA